MGDFLSNFFNPAPAAPTLASYNPISPTAALQQFLGQQSSLPALQSFANQTNQGSNQAWQQMLFASSPTLQANYGQFGQNTSALLNGQIPADVQAQVQNNAAFQALQGGYGGSNMAHALTARDLGTTSLGLQQQGAQNLGQQQQLAQQLNPSNLQTSSLFYSPQTILSRDDQANLINQQIQNQNSQISYQNSLQQSPFSNLLSNNLASLFGAVGNGITGATGKGFGSTPGFNATTPSGQQEQIPGNIGGLLGLATTFFGGV